MPADLEEQKIVATGVYGTTLLAVDGNYDDVNRLCMELAGDRPVGLRQRQRAPLLQRGLQDAGLRGRRAARLVACPTAASSRSPRARSTPRSTAASTTCVETGLVDGRARRSSTAPRPPAAARWPRPGPRAATSSRPCGRTRSPRASPSATRPTASSPSTWPAPTGGAIAAVTEEEIVDGIALLAETTGIFTETAGGVTTAVLAKLAARRGHRPRRARRALHHRGRPQDPGRGRRPRPPPPHRAHRRQLRGRPGRGPLIA